MNRTKAVVRWLFVPRTDSPTLAYYAGLVSGVWLTIQVAQIVESIREEREWQEKLAEASEEFDRELARTEAYLTGE